jgi:hypothetical protein
MKLANLIFGLLAIVMIQSCEGPPGPEGQPGVNGVNGVNIVAEVFEVKLDFTPQNNFERVFNLTPAILNSDVILVYIQWEKEGNTPIWRALPQTAFFDQGILVYNYDFTSKDFRIFMDGQVNLTSLSAEWKTNQTFRVIIVPGKFSSARIDLTNYEAVTALLGLKDEDFQKIDLRKKN